MKAEGMTWPCITGCTGWLLILARSDVAPATNQLNDNNENVPLFLIPWQDSFATQVSVLIDKKGEVANSFLLNRAVRILFR